MPKFLDDRRLQAIEGLAKPRIEAEELRRSEKLKRKAVEADVKRKAEELRKSIDASTQQGGDGTAGGTIIDIIRPAQAVAAPALPPAAVTPPAAPPVRAMAGAAALPLARPPAPAAAPTVCPAPGTKGTATTSALPGGRVRIDITEPCRKGEPLTIRYAPYVFIRMLDDNGRLGFVLDLFQGGEAPVSLLFQDGESRPLTIPGTDLDKVSKIAVIWGKAVNLDLHVFEYAAAAGSAGHIWAKAPSSVDAARDTAQRSERGRGFLSLQSDGTEPGHQVEVYTLWHHAGQSGGIVSTALDYETRGASADGETCGKGALAEIPFETVALAPGRPAVRERGLVAAAACGAPLIEKARYLDDVIADLPLGPG